MNAWVKHPKLWAAAMDKAANDLPRFTKAFWRRVSTFYQDLGGSYEEIESELEWENEY